MFGRIAQAARSWMGGPKPQITNRLVSHIDTEVQLFEELGSGRFGVCRRGVLRRNPTTSTTTTKQDAPAVQVAVKSIIKSRASAHDMRNELRVLEKLKAAGECRNVVQLLDAFEDKSTVFVVTPLYAGGELFDRISQQRVFTEADASAHMLDLLNAIRYCHSNNIVHRDVKPENLLFASSSSAAAASSSSSSSLVLVDFGMSRICEDQEEEMELQCGSPSYVAPEVLERNYTMKCDVWSCGIILHILLVGGTPFGNGTDEEILHRVEHFNSDVFLSTLQQPEWTSVSEEAKQLCARMLTRNAGERPTADECYALVDQWHRNSASHQSARPLNVMAIQANLARFNSFRRLKKATVRCVAEMIRRNAALMAAAEGGGGGKETEAVRLANTLAELQLYGTVPLSVLQDKLHLPGLTELLLEHQAHKNGSSSSLAASSEPSIDVNDLVASALTKSVLLDEEYLLAAFKKFDSSGDGKLDVDELTAALMTEDGATSAAAVDKDVVLDVMRHLDKNKDGTISYEEFAHSLREPSFTSETVRKRELTLMVGAAGK